MLKYSYSCLREYTKMQYWQFIASVCSGVQCKCQIAACNQFKPVLVTVNGLQRFSE